MNHESEGDKNGHYTIHGENDDGEKRKGGHVHEDEAKQTVRHCAPLVCYYLANLTAQQAN